MKVSYNWLGQYVNLNQMSAAKLAELMTSGGIEIDIIEQLNKGITGVVIGYVESIAKHPDADKLNVCQVDVGQAEKLQIVCGAANVAAGQKVPVAVVGAKLPGDFKIKRAKLRGVESQGMICSAKELGINDKLLPKEQQEGILVLPEHADIGTPIIEWLDLDDEVLELDLTPNRSDCLSMLGVAYEVAALTEQQVQLPELNVQESAVQAKEHIAVKIAAAEQCTHYSARYITNIQIAQSPQWLQNRLLAAGIRPINNVVDVTNFVMLEYGQPLHAFDAAKIANGNITVRLAEQGEQLVTLDNQERKLEAHMLVIADDEGAIGLAGVMGGASSEVTNTTMSIILESAKFAGDVVRKTSRQLGLRSEASARFEKGSDRNYVLPALDRAAALIAELTGGEVASGVVEDRVSEQADTVIALDVDRINRYLGTTLVGEQVAAIFTRLGFSYEHNRELNQGTFQVTVPSRRGDITREVDLIEEVARIYGYDLIPTTPIYGEVIPGALTKEQVIRRELRRRLASAGMYEVIGYSLTAPDKATLFPQLAEAVEPIKLAMPMSEERSVLRTTLAAQLIDIATHNRNRKNDSLAFFEIGSVYHTNEVKLTKLPNEKHRFAALITGQKQQEQWNVKAQSVDFYDAKGITETIFEVLGVTEYMTYAAAQPENFHPGRTAAIYMQLADGSEQVIGYVGQLHPSLQLAADLADTYVVELALEPLYARADAEIEYIPLPRYPAIERDIALVVDETIAAAQLLAVARAAAGELLESARIFDVYTGDKLGAGKKSVAVALIYRHSERTLTDEEVTERHQHVVEQLEQTFAAQLRK
ncbi:phenylalanine--tRNA ligase subunit beta [Paenibacillus yanchengensis]|uniref:Phenylalanine--tRNA ligase beta subunit n=1 Tax=Paenibacillus yanchengensis TaxID=2035833 RepID=A0ABW4YG09_9BACL